MNKVILIGRLVRDVEIKTISTTGNAVVNNAIAVSRYRTSNTGERIEETLFIDVVFYNRLAEIVGQYLRKGSKLMAEGYLQQQNWVDTATNQNRSKIQLVVENMEMLDNKPEETNAARNNVQANNNYARPTQNNYQQNNFSRENNSYQKQNNFAEERNNYNYNSSYDEEIPF
ncbi:single-stranded DNA-binding protein [Campylobacter sp. RM5004]|uniref:single-stranded DNA-binding protein n=1 Tax=Campylobacter sp. RM5004 TaxID=1660078 RepID=UPI001EFB87FE|nr:single-stranded DNA-binding protein [Campylobacter sp. RM5004]ULO02419.1 single-stranded DNA-binding protein [Campylobacter sp. RM5004]